MANRFKSIIRQPKYYGGRIQCGTGLIPNLEALVQREMARYGVTRPFVIATCVSFCLEDTDDKEQPDYKTIRQKIRRK